jgi:hypothetical protein
MGQLQNRGGWRLLPLLRRTHRASRDWKYDVALSMNARRLAVIGFQA